MIPPAAIAVIRAAIEDAHLAELTNRPGHAAVRIARALEEAGWDMPLSQPENARHKAA
jgi:hypothetical protein